MTRSVHRKHTPRPALTVAAADGAPAPDWKPSLEGGLKETGVTWDAVAAPSFLGDDALTALGERSGAVIRDPYGHRLYWLLPLSSTGLATWPRLERIEVYGPACWIDVPPAGHTGGIGPYWEREPRPGHVLTDPQVLHSCLTAVQASWFGPRAEAER